MPRKILNFLFDSTFQVVTWVWIGVSIGAFFFFASSKNTWGMVLSVISLFASVAVMLGLIATKHFWDSDGKRKRPELYVSGALMKPLKVGEPETVVLGLKNRGNGIARNIRLGRGNHLFAPASFTGPLECKPSDSDTRPDLGPDEETSLVSPSQNPLSQDRLSDLQSGKLLFFHFAEGEYDDDDGRAYPVDYCFMYAPLAPTVMRTCPEMYWPKDRAARKFPKRPDLFVKSAAVNLIAGQSVDIYVIFINRGDETATNMWMEGVTTVKPKTFKGPLERKGMTRSDVPIRLAPGADMTAILREPNRWSKEGVAAIKSEKYLLFHYGRGEYEDAAGNRYPIEYCLRYERDIPESGSGMPYMGFCDPSFWPKDSGDA